MGGSDIRVTPSALQAAGGSIRDEAARVREAAAPVVSAAVSSAAAVGEPNCAQALQRAELLVNETGAECATGLLALAETLEAASGTYTRADVVAFPRASYGAG